MRAGAIPGAPVGLVGLVGLAMLLGGAAPVGAQSETVSREYVQLRPQTFGLLYSPTPPRPESSVGLVLMHPKALTISPLSRSSVCSISFSPLVLKM